MPVWYTVPHNTRTLRYSLPVQAKSAGDSQHMVLVAGLCWPWVYARLTSQSYSTLFQLNSNELTEPIFRMNPVRFDLHEFAVTVRWAKPFGYSLGQRWHNSVFWWALNDATLPVVDASSIRRALKHNHSANSLTIPLKSNLSQVKNVIASPESELNQVPTKMSYCGVKAKDRV